MGGKVGIVIMDGILFGTLNGGPGSPALAFYGVQVKLPSWGWVERPPLSLHHSGAGKPGT